MQDLSYDPVTGAISRKGNAVGSVDKTTGYVRFRVRGRLLLAHRVAWFCVHGYWPKMLDHVNGNRSDNRLSNLREATRQENARNSKARRRLKGAYRLPYGRWRSAIFINGRQKHIGVFDTEEEASAAYFAAAQEHFGAFARAA